MIQIIQEKRKPSFGEKFSNAVGAGIQGADQIMQGIESGRRNEQAIQTANQLLGFDTSGLDPDTRKALMLQGFKQQGEMDLANNKFANEMQKTNQDTQEKVKPLEGALDILNQMKSLRKKGNLGIGSTYSPFGQTRKEAGEYEQLGKALIQYATNIPIRNRIEFETLAENLYDPTTTDAKAEGILNAMQRIIENSIQSAGGQISKGSSSIGSSKNQQRKPLSSFSIGAK